MGNLRNTLLLAVFIFGFALPTLAAPRKVLVVSITTGFRHSSIETGEKVLEELAKSSGAFSVDFVRQPEPSPKSPQNPKRDARDTDESFAAKQAAYAEAMKTYLPERKAWEDKINAYSKEALAHDKIKGYDGFIFCNTTGDLPFPDPQGFIDLIKGGKAFIAMHSATDTFHKFRPYIEMIGGEFDGHPWTQKVTVKNEDKKHPAGAPWPEVFEIDDEIYQMKSYSRDDKHVILSLDKSNDDRPKTKSKRPDGTEGELKFFERGKRTDGDYAVSWVKEFGTGKVFYTSLGHREDVWKDPTYQAHILGGIKWALGE